MLRRCIFVCALCLFQGIYAQSHLAALKSMFNEMVVHKDISVMPKYYDRSFVLYSNGQSMNYETYYKGHAKIYKTPIQYRIRFDPQTIVDQGDKVAARLFITTQLPRQQAKKIEVILVAQYRAGKIVRLWELTYPNWVKLKAFRSFSKS